MAKTSPVGQNVPKQNVPSADQSFFSACTGCGDKMLIDIFIHCHIYAYAWVAAFKFTDVSRTRVDRHPCIGYIKHKCDSDLN